MTTKTATDWIDDLVAGKVTLEEVERAFASRSWAPSPAVVDALDVLDDVEMPNENSWEAVSTDPRLTSQQYQRLGRAAASSIMPDVTAAAYHTGAMIALVPSSADAERLAVDGGEPVEELHVTLGYLGEAALIPAEVQRNIVRCVAKCVNKQVSIVANAFAVAMFNPEDGSSVVAAAGKEPCVVLLVSGQQLEPFHDYVMNDVAMVFAAAGMEMHEQHSPWVAHLTLAYTGDADLSYFTDRVGAVTFDKIRIAFGGTVVDLPLGGEPDMSYEEG